MIRIQSNYNEFVFRIKNKRKRSNKSYKTIQMKRRRKVIKALSMMKQMMMYVKYINISEFSSQFI